MTVLDEHNIDLEDQYVDPSVDSEEEGDSIRGHFLFALALNFIYLIIFGILNGMIFYSGCGYDLLGVVFISVFLSILLTNLTVLLLNHNDPKTISISAVFPIMVNFVFFVFTVYYTNCLGR